ncbi:MAG TPA: hypothetical protein VHQ90_06410 [Thermoanaerobaculia bacterium]|nr:hypothetical protein [Thermoanaerobaculia bacterium]
MGRGDVRGVRTPNAARRGDPARAASHLKLAFLAFVEFDLPGDAALAALALARLYVARQDLANLRRLRRAVRLVTAGRYLPDVFSRPLGYALIAAAAGRPDADWLLCAEARALLGQGSATVPYLPGADAILDHRPPRLGSALPADSPPRRRTAGRPPEPASRPR